MANNPEDEIENYIANPFGVMQMKGLRIGRISIDEVSVAGREAAIHFQEILNAACDKTKRLRNAKDGTRYPEPLPVAHPARLLSVEIDDYLKDMDRRGLASGTIGDCGRTLGWLRFVCGDIPVHRIDYKHIYLLWDVLRWAPSGITTFPGFDRMTPEVVIELGQKQHVAPPAESTFAKHRSLLSAFFNQLVKKKAIPGSPIEAFADVKKDLVIDPNRAERLFDEADLQRIFAPATFIPWAIKYPHRWWVPLIGLYTGARINEVCQLKVADIAQEGGVWCIRIQKTVDPDLAHKTRGRSRQSLKGKSAVRTLPIAQPLLDAGFLDFLDDMKACGHPRLFPHLSAGINRTTGETNARYSQAAVSQFGSYLKTLGVPKGVGFHAFRHTLATELHHLGVQEEDIALVTGHSVSKKVPVLHEAYFHKKPALAREKQIKALEQYRPAVELPVYKPGQFHQQLKAPSKFYP